VPRAGLTPRAVVEEAERMVDDVGFEGMTLAALAERLGVRQPSLYKHIDGVAGLRRAIAIRAARELTEVLGRAAVGRARGDAITAMAAAHRKWGLAHPGRYQVSQTAPELYQASRIAPDPGGEHEKVVSDYVQMFSDVLSGFGLAGDDAIDAIRGIRAALHGFVSLEAGGGFAMPHDIDRSHRRLVAALVDALDHWATGSAPAALPGTGETKTAPSRSLNQVPGPDAPARPAP
jgi:AcrR family transcriptional regulator